MSSVHRRISAGLPRRRPHGGRAAAGTHARPSRAGPARPLHVPKTTSDGTQGGTAAWPTCRVPPCRTSPDGEGSLMPCRVQDNAGHRMLRALRFAPPPLRMGGSAPVSPSPPRRAVQSPPRRHRRRRRSAVQQPPPARCRGRALAPAAAAPPPPPGARPRQGGQRPPGGGGGTPRTASRLSSLPVAKTGLKYTIRVGQTVWARRL